MENRSGQDLREGANGDHAVEIHRRDLLLAVNGSQLVIHQLGRPYGKCRIGIYLWKTFDPRNRHKNVYVDAIAIEQIDPRLDIRQRRQ
jgi:hypothetical protein